MTKIYSKTFSIIFFLLACHLFAQNGTNKIIYSSFFGEDESFKSLGRKAIDQYKNEIEQQEFELIFNHSLAHFQTIDKLDLSLPTVNIFKSKDAHFAYKTIQEEKILLKLPRNQTWQFSNETKKIGNFICYRATSNYLIIRGDKTMTFPIIAWFTPEIPFGFGPMGYGGLPGMILELQVRNITYGAQKIMLKTSNQLIEFPNKNDFKLMTEQEWEAMVLKRMEDE
jgi:GLPGLI family protein